MSLSKGQINKIAIRELDRRGVEAWQQNNARTVRGHTFKGRRGVSDILGYNRKTGVIVATEVKTLDDIMSHDQFIFLTGVKLAGGVALVAIESKRTGNVELIDISEAEGRVKIIKAGK